MDIREQATGTGWEYPWYPRSYAKSWVAVGQDGSILAVLIGPDWSAESAMQELERQHAGCTVRECAKVCVHHQWNLQDWRESAMFAAEEG